MSKSITDKHIEHSLDKAAEWYVKRDGEPLSASDEAAFEAWLAADPANRTAYDEVSQLWREFGAMPRSVIASATAVQRRGFGWRGMSAMALAASLACAAFLFDLPTLLRADAASGKGEIKAITLEDGSTAVLNTASAIAFHYTLETRTIRLLRGEAAFTVAHDAKRPFVVKAEDGAARALGTAFVVAREQDGAVVTVLENRVTVTYPANDLGGVTLSAGQQVEYERGTGLKPVETVDVDATTAWRRGKLIFTDRPLGSVVAELNRYYSGWIQIVDSSIADRRVSGVFEIRDPVQTVSVLEASLGLRTTRLSRFLILLHR